MFVGDSLQRNQWISFICLVDSVIPKDKKSMKRGRVHSVFKAKVIHHKNLVLFNNLLEQTTGLKFEKNCDVTGI